MQQLHSGYEVTRLYHTKTLFMKRPFSFLWAAFALLLALPGCSPYLSPSNPTPGSALVTIECRDATAERQILELLRSGRAKDISVRADGSSLEITAAFSPEYTPAGRLGQILQDLNELNGVLYVEVVENPHPIRQNF
jgi:hypothetical protein